MKIYTIGYLTGIRTKTNANQPIFTLANIGESITLHPPQCFLAKREAEARLKSLANPSAELIELEASLGVAIAKQMIAEGLEFIISDKLRAATFGNQLWYKQTIDPNLGPGVIDKVLDAIIQACKEPD